MRWLIELRDIEADETEIREIRRTLIATLTEMGVSARSMTCELAVAEQTERLRTQRSVNGVRTGPPTDWLPQGTTKRRRLGIGPSG